MFDSITGTLVRKDPRGVILSAGGIGYTLLTPKSTLSALPDGGEMTLYCHLAVRDDSMKLYGFLTPIERDLFLKIMSVGGIGAALALNLLSDIPPKKFLKAIATEQLAILQGVKGIGSRTAKRMVIELKGKLDFAGVEGLGDVEESAGLDREGRLGRDLLAALQALGYPRAAARDAAAKALSDHPESDNLEFLIRAALTAL